MRHFLVFDKTYYSFTIISKIITKKIKHTILETCTKKKSLRNLTRFHGGLFELEILEIFTAAFLLKTITSQVMHNVLLKNKKNLLKKDASHLKGAWIEKRERKTKNEKKPNKSNKYFFDTFNTFFI